MMKKSYIEQDFEIVVLRSSDVITLSGYEPAEANIDDFANDDE